jgi:hypothetical protein
LEYNIKNLEKLFTKAIINPFRAYQIAIKLQHDIFIDAYAMLKTIDSLTKTYNSSTIFAGKVL